MFAGELRFDAVGRDSTKVTICLTFPSQQQRDDCVEKYGAVEGGEQNLARLAEAVALRTADAFVVSREFAAPRDVVWLAWTTRESYDAWFGPVGFATESKTFDMTPGGIIHHRMSNPEGGEMWGRWRILDVVPGRRLAFINSFSDEAGGLRRHEMAPGWPAQFLSSVSFEDTASGGTRVTVVSTPLEATADEQAEFVRNHDSMQGGWGGTFGRLEAFLAREG
jgi:uncharacterized protein YndB with AHSA1/START domain